MGEEENTRKVDREGERARGREREREREREERKPQGSELSWAISLAERSSFGSANARLPCRNRKLRLGFHLRCCAERVGARLGGIRREKASRCPATRLTRRDSLREVGRSY